MRVLHKRKDSFLATHSPQKTKQKWLCQWAPSTCLISTCSSGQCTWFPSHTSPAMAKRKYKQGWIRIDLRNTITSLIVTSKCRGPKISHVPKKRKYSIFGNKLGRMFRKTIQFCCEILGKSSWRNRTHSYIWILRIKMSLLPITVYISTLFQEKKSE